MNDSGSAFRFSLPVSMAVATNSRTSFRDTSVGFIERMAALACRLHETFGWAANSALHVLAASDFLKMPWVLARGKAAQMVEMFPCGWPASMFKKEGHAVRWFRTMLRLDVDVPIAGIITTSDPGPTFIRPALINLWPVTLFKSLWAWAFHGLIVTHW